MSIITLITGLIAAIDQVLHLKDADEDDEDLEALASEMEEVEERLNAQDAKLATLEDELHHDIR